ncbi:Myb-like protein isoform 2 [Schistosoma japonicum]|uniref:Myb-like protein isoform 2 n=3 Tax=Schistosoma japonicum TaxID=6182 RepID=A0A4Z2D5P4_SCHJA|nr:Myb-like protein isoform 2 [Schistosoma japonicum]TNN11813.1 Myb-like protein isoform 2 [Schistosoma japonicum]
MALCEQGRNNSSVINCVVINKTVQHILPEIISTIRDEIKLFNHYLKDLSGDYIVSNSADRMLHKPFLRLSNGENPPPNSDTILRIQRKEYNLSDVRATSGKRWLKKELISLIKAVSTCVRSRQIQILENKRDILLSKVSKTCRRKSKSKTSHVDTSVSSVESSHSLLAKLEDCESKLFQTHLMSSAPPKWLVSALASTALSDSNGCLSVDIFKKDYGHKLRNENSYSQSAKSWYELLSSADNIISSSDWTEISNLASKTYVSDVNARLTWIHRLQPNINRSKWSAEEDKRLTELVGEFGEHGCWEEISKVLNTNRTAFTCFQRWQTVLNPNFRMYRPWTTSEDTALMDILKNLLKFSSPGLMEWDVVSAYHPTRSANECRSRAPMICAVFQNVIPKAQEIVDPYTSSTQSTNSQVSSSCAPFSLAEDLQLLMAVQRYGIAGGRVGHGGGIGVGSWALVTTALPGRSAFSCRKRYFELCEEFQPWTYDEDYKLYHSVLSFGPFTSMGCWKTGPSIQIFTNLLPYFPGRSAHSLQSRFNTLRRWARLWCELRLQITGRSDDLVSCNSSPSLERNILLYSPFATQFVTQLRNAGVSDPETEAYRILTTWKTLKEPVKSDYIWSNNDWKPDSIDRDFTQLLDELVSGVLIQRLQPNNNSEKTDIISHSSSLSNPGEQHEQNHEMQMNATSEVANQSATFKRLSFSESKWIIHQTQMKNVLVGPVRRCLTVMAGIRVSDFVHQPSSMLTRRRDYTTGHNSTRITRQCKENRALLLLRKEHLFWMILDQVMRDPKVKLSLQRINKISMLKTAAPFIARQMVLHFSHKPLASTFSEHRNELKKGHTNLSLRKSRRCKKALRSKLLEKYLKKFHDQSNSSHIRAQVLLARRKSLYKDKMSPSSDLISLPTSTTTATSSVVLYTGETTVGTTVCSTSTTTVADANICTADVITASNSNAAIADKHLTELTEEKRRLLLEIHNILKAFGRKRYNSHSAYALSTNFWSRRLKPVEVSTNKHERYMPPIIRDLPPTLAVRFFYEPELLSTRCMTIARSCLTNGLDIHTNETNRSDSINLSDDQPSFECTASLNLTDSQLSNLKKAHILPPNYATILGFKSLLMHLSTLLEKEKGKFSQFTELSLVFGNSCWLGREQVAVYV